MSEDLVTTMEAARLLGFKHDASVHHYLKTRANFPRPVEMVRVGRSRKYLWSRRELLTWNETSKKRRRAADARSIPTPSGAPDTLAIQFITGKFRPEGTP